MAPLADLQNDRFFPAFRSCPPEDDMTAEYFYAIHENFLVPNRHWCLLAQITMKNQGTFKRQPVLQLEDKMQDRFLMGFYPEDVTEIRTQDYQVGDTMVILYAFKYGDGKELIELRVLDTADVKVIPLELSRILALNHKVQLHNKTSAGKSACHACGTEGKALLKCAQCGLFWYCDSECQKLGWYRDGHDEDCKDLKKFKGLFTWDWANFEDYANSSII